MVDILLRQGVEFRAKVWPVAASLRYDPSWRMYYVYGEGGEQEYEDYDKAIAEFCMLIGLSDTALDNKEPIAVK
jgi:hypothetical protein